MRRDSHHPATAARAAPRVAVLRPSQRMLAQGVMALSAQLLRMAQAGEFLQLSATMVAVMAQRRAVLRGLQSGIRSPAELTCVEAVSGAVAESDRGLLVMMDNARRQREA